MRFRPWLYVAENAQEFHGWLARILGTGEPERLRQSAWESRVSTVRKRSWSGLTGFSKTLHLRSRAPEGAYDGQVFALTGTAWTDFRGTEKAE